MARAASTQRRVTMTVLAWAVALLLFFPILYTLITSLKTEGSNGDANCAKTRSWDVPLDSLPDGDYTVRAVATDQLGIKATETWPLRIDRGVPPELRQP